MGKVGDVDLGRGISMKYRYRQGAALMRRRGHLSPRGDSFLAGGMLFASLMS